MQRAAQTFARDLADYNLLAPQAEKELNIKLHEVSPLESFTFGAFSVMAFPANHAPGMGAMLYSVSTNGRSVFYGTDTSTQRRRKLAQTLIGGQARRSHPEHERLSRFPLGDPGGDCRLRTLFH